MEEKSKVRSQKAKELAREGDTTPTLLTYDF
jgi:hypothetical protein